MSYRMRLEFLDTVPERRPAKKVGKYDVLLMQFVRSGKPAAKVSPPDTVKISTVIGGFRKAVARGKVPVVVMKQGKDVYLCMESEVKHDSED